MNWAIPMTATVAQCQSADLALWRASWQAGVSVLAVWAICYVLPKLPASARCWLWRLVLLRFVLTLFWPVAIPLPILPVNPLPTRPSVAVARRASAPHPALPQSMVPQSRAATTVVPYFAPVAERTTPPSPAAGSAPVPANTVLGLLPARSAQRPLPAATVPVPAATVPVVPTATADGVDSTVPKFAPLLPAALFALYLAGVAACVFRLVRRGLQTRRFLRDSCRSLGDSETGQVAVSLCRRLGLPRVPRIVYAPDVAASQLIAAFPPIVLLPRDHADREVRRLMLAHELAHLRRRDLVWSGLSALAHILFFFHPLLWLARREEDLAREMACDALVLAATDATPARCLPRSWGKSGVVRGGTRRSPWASPTRSRTSDDG